MSQQLEFSDFAIVKVDQRAVYAVLGGVALGVAFWSGLFVVIAG